MSTAAAWADLADLVLTLARDIRGPGYSDRTIVPLTDAECTVMRFVDRNPGSTLGTVAVATGFQRSNLSTLVSSLAGRGLVEKRASASDARVVELHPTPAAGENLERLRAEWSAVLEDAVAHSSATAPSAAALEQASAVLSGLLDGMAERRISRSTTSPSS
jgi:DNA-binding MarR family transcriptional regulator